MGIALSTAAGLGVGLLAGLLANELFGSLDSERMRRVLGRLRKAPEPGSGLDPADIEEGVTSALQQHATTRPLAIVVRALGEGIVELTGTAPTKETRVLAGQVARRAPGADVVVNRILVEGWDLPAHEPSPSSAG